MSGRVVHFEIPFDDADRASRFYAEAFGWTLNHLPDMEYTQAVTGPSEAGPSEAGFINGGMTRRGLPLAAPTVVIDVADIDAALATVEELGGTTLLARTSVGEIGWSAYFNDTEGNVIGLWQSV